LELDISIHRKAAAVCTALRFGWWLAVSV